MKVVFIALIALYSVFVSVNADCGQNEEYLLCQPCRALSCGQTPPEVCIAVCQNEGCYCQVGYLRQNGVCVPQARC